MSKIKKYLVSIIIFSLIIVKNLPTHLLRKIILKYFFKAKIGKKVGIYMGVEIRSPWKLHIGDGSIIGHNCTLDARRTLLIGKNVNISSDAVIWTLHHDYNSKGFDGIGGTVTIEDYAWICNRAIILPNVTIGKGAVVAAGAVVTKNVDAYTVVGGIPAKKIANRSTELEYHLDYLPIV